MVAGGVYTGCRIRDPDPWDCCVDMAASLLQVCIAALGSRSNGLLARIVTGCGGLGR